MPRLLDPLVGPLTDLLMLLTSALHSYGLAIIVFTILVRAALTPLTLRQLRAAKRMAALAPRLKQLQQTYKGNREELVRAQMALYKELSGDCQRGVHRLAQQHRRRYPLGSAGGWCAGSDAGLPGARARPCGDWHSPGRRTAQHGEHPGEPPGPQARAARTAETTVS